MTQSQSLSPYYLFIYFFFLSSSLPYSCKFFLFLSSFLSSFISFFHSFILPFFLSFFLSFFLPFFLSFFLSFLPSHLLPLSLSLKTFLSLKIPSKFAVFIFCKGLSSAETSRLTKCHLIIPQKQKDKEYKIWFVSAFGFSN